MIYVLSLLLAAVIAAGDQIFKLWITANVEYCGVRPLWPGIVGLTYVKNTGGAFSFMSGMMWLLLPVTAVSLAIIIYCLIKVKMSPACRISVSMILGGAIGNAIDRFRLGYVVDMIELQFIDYAIFNIADCFIVVGTILFCILYFLRHIMGAGKKPESGGIGRYPEEEDRDDNC